MPVIVIEDENAIATELQKASGKLVVVDFTATWCAPCKQIAPFYEELSVKYPSTVFLKVDVDDNSEIAMQYDVTAMPTFLFLKKLKEIDRVMGADYQGLESRVHSWGGSSSSFVDPSLTSDKSNRTSSQGINNKPTREYDNSRGPNMTSGNDNTHAAILALSKSMNPPGNTQTQAAIDALSLNSPPSSPPKINPNQQQQQQRGVHLLPPGYNSFYQGSPQPQQGNPIMTAQYNSNQGQMSTEVSKSRMSSDKDNYESENSNTLNGVSTEEIRGDNGKEVKEKKKKSSHRTRSSHRKESQHSSNMNSMTEMTPRSNKENEAMAQKALKVKKKLPTSVVQIRLADGTKTTATFNTTHPVSKIREFINNARPAYATKSFVLMTIFPSREISNEEQTLQDAKLINAIIVQRLTP